MSHLLIFNQKKKNMHTKIKLFLELVNDAEYFEAHEVLESIWHGYEDRNSAEALVLKALINGAVSLEHAKRGNKSGATKCAETYLKYRPMLDELGSHEKTLLKPVCKNIEMKMLKENIIH